MAKRILSLILAVVTVLSLAVPAFAEEAEPAATEAPAPVETPAETEIPAETAAPAETEIPAEAEEAAETEAPVETAAPAETEEPLDGADAPADAPASIGEPTQAIAALPTEGTCGDAVHWSLSADGVLTVTGSGEMDDFAEQPAPWLDPDTLTDSRVKKVVIDSGVTYVGAYAFSFCRALTEAVIPGTVEGIGTGAFARCASLSRVELGSGLQAIGQGAFLECGSLRQIELPDTLQSVGHLAFSSCLALEDVTLPRALKSIGQYAFSNCEALKTIVIPDGVTSIGAMAFTGCVGLTSVSLGAGLLTIGDYAFGSCASLRSVTLPEQLTSLGVQAFSRTALTSVTLPASVSQVGFAAFAGCQSLKSITVMNDKCAFSLARPEGDESDEAAALGIPGLTTVYGAAGSTAETFARRYGFGFAERQSGVPIFTPQPVPTEPPAPVRPVISAVEAASSGIKLTWQPMDGAGKYRVYYATEINGDGTPVWKKLADTSATSYTWKKASNNKTYYFSLRCMDAKAKKYLSDYARGVPFKRLSTPTVTLSNKTDGILVSWKDVKAGQYKVTVDGEERSVANGSVMPAENNTTYKVVVQAVDANGTALSAASSKSIKYLTAPAISAVEAVSSGIKLTWNKVEDVTKYRIYYATKLEKDGTPAWKKLTDTKGTAAGEALTYTWKKASYKTYWFTVAAMNGKSVGSAKYEDMGDTITLLKPPSVTLSNKINGILVKWSDIKAAKYKVTVNGTVVAPNETGTEYLYTGVTNNTKYTVTVQGLGEDGTSKLGKVSATKSILYLDAPKITDMRASTSGIQISWDAVIGAAKYRVYYKTETGKWTKLANTGSTSYNWKKAKTGTTYYFTVVCMDKKYKKTTSAKYEGTDNAFTLQKTPTVTPAVTADGIKLTIKDASDYKLTVKQGKTVVLDTKDSKTEYLFTNVASGKKYTFTVQAMKGGKAMSKASAAKSVTYIAPPALSGAANTGSGVKVSWGKVSGAAKYRVLYKTEGGAWKKLADTAKTSYTWTKGVSGTLYTFTVECVDSKGKKVTSKYDETGLSVRYIKLDTLWYTRGHYYLGDGEGDELDILYVDGSKKQIDVVTYNFIMPWAFSSKYTVAADGAYEYPCISGAGDIADAALRYYPETGQFTIATDRVNGRYTPMERHGETYPLPEGFDKEWYCYPARFTSIFSVELDLNYWDDGTIFPTLNYRQCGVEFQKDVYTGAACGGVYYRPVYGKGGMYYYPALDVVILDDDGKGDSVLYLRAP